MEILRNMTWEIIEKNRRILEEPTTGWKPTEHTEHEKLKQKAILHQLHPGTMTASEAARLKELEETSQPSQKELDAERVIHRALIDPRSGGIDGATAGKLLAEINARPDPEKKQLTEKAPTWTEAKAKIWERQRRGEISIDDAASLASTCNLLGEQEKIALAPPVSGRRLLTEQRGETCDNDCDCSDCHLEGYRKLLDRYVAAGRCTIEQANGTFSLRCTLKESN